MIRSNRSIARRLALLFALVALAVFTLVDTGLFLVLRSQVEQRLRDSLDSRTEVARIIVHHVINRDKWRIAQEKLADMTPRDGTNTYAISSTTPLFNYGHPVTGQIAQQWHGDYARITHNGTGHDMLTRTLNIPANGERPQVQLQVATSYAPTEQALREFGLALAALSALGAFGASLLSYWVTRIGLAPLRRLTIDASEVSADNRSQRLRTAELPLELNDLAHSFNGALERLDQAYCRLESFNADVAHELRTPVTILIGQTQVALTRNRAVDDLRRTLQSNLEEFERMRGIINDMLFLARADQGERATELVEVSLATEVAHTVEFLEMPMEEAHVRAQLHGDAVARVNRPLFGRACANLLINAIHHSMPGSTITVTISREAGRVWVAVANRGEPIAPDVLDHVFDRFYRAELSRTNSRENHGLGLAIVKAVAEMHGGVVFVRSLQGVNTFGFSIRSANKARSPKADAQTKEAQLASRQMASTPLKSP
ncbi:heavy metal sensor histidine kinase [Paraburkholderia sp. LEh10]|uniref:heavy metal sensor histidine kinase n=1 Tax=Paraburkholderia sp. LEh10 TaxID=2821353 RepID=UPI001AE13A02|nr:heavy metal sensor histidine kinase [Paraburkholderia sp. LEh10]MBP0594139.1 heavy metal sensor histidine kinase [Paraburkholderia sp. LEh10]